MARKQDADARRKSEKKKQSQSKAAHSQTVFRDGVDTFTEIRKYLYRSEQQRHKSLLEVVEIAPGDPTYTLHDDDLQKHLGYGDYTAHLWTVENAGGYEKLGTFAEGHTGGVTNWLRDSYGKLHTLVMMRPLGAEAFDSADKDTLQGIALSLFFHEMGHVDDFEKGVNFKEGQQVDLSKAEEYAHWYTCKRLKQHNLKVPLAFYVNYCLRQFASHEVEMVKLAGEAVLNSPELDQYRDFMRPFDKVWLD